jgi:uncharacterized low-complexity protein
MRGNRGILAAAIVGALALAVATTSASASTSTGTATSAKKKCRKAHSKKRKCKRKKKADVPRSPVIRATLTWGNGGADDVDMDLFVFDSSGNVAGNGSNTIPLTALSSDVSGPAGSETFTDSLFTPQAARDLSFGVCYSVGGSVHTNFTLTYVTADGVVHGDSQNPGSSFHYEYPGGASIPINYCGFS